MHLPCKLICDKEQVLSIQMILTHVCRTELDPGGWTGIVTC